MLAAGPITPLKRALVRSANQTPLSPQVAFVRTDDAEEKRKRRKSFVEDRLRRASTVFSPAKKTSAVSTPGRPVLSEEELRRSFEEWMKIAADNKINATNSWNLALIDYFHDMSLLRDGDSINFQKASCTLDGCVKIYTSRVDSVDSETKKLLSGLVDTDPRGRKMDEDHEDDNDDIGQENKPAKKRATRSGNTLEKDVNNLNVKKFDLEFMVDPLFKKTSADFDEGGAHGLLLNHLNISTDGKIIFDASDAGTSPSYMQRDTEVAGPAQPATSLDITKLKGETSLRFRVLEVYANMCVDPPARFGNNLKNMWDQQICPTLKEFEFGSSNSGWTLFNNSSTLNMPFVDDPHDEVNPFEANEPLHPTFDDDSDDGELADEDNAISGIGGISFPETAIVMTMSNEQDNVFSYFDTAMLRSWAGPEHWRSRPLQKDKDKGTKDANKRKRKPEFTLDFLGEDDIAPEQLFAAGAATITLPKQSEKTKSQHLLPDDMHFSSKDLLRLFLKPEYKIKFYRKDRTSSIPVEQDGPVDEVFWAEHQTDQSHTEGAGGELLPFSAHDSDDDDDVDEDVSLPHESENMALDFGDQLVDQPKKVKAVPLSYARVAKKVDVKKLKENIWKELTVKDSTEPIMCGERARVEEPRTFTDVVHGLDQVYPEKKRKDISVAFCFICVLHLANEQNLKVLGNSDLSNLTISQDGGQ